MHFNHQAQGGGGFGNEGGFARCRLDQVDAALRAHDRDHQAGQSPAAADIRERALGRGVHGREPGKSVEHVPLRGLGRVAYGRHTDWGCADKCYEPGQAIELRGGHVGGAGSDRTPCLLRRRFT
jgi:hypothetical protein